MGRAIRKVTTTKRKSPKTPTPLLSLEEQLKVFANVIVDRILEEQQNGNVLLSKEKQHG